MYYVFLINSVGLLPHDYELMHRKRARASSNSLKIAVN